MTVKSADKKPEKYVGPDGKPKIRMVSVDKEVVKSEGGMKRIATTLSNKADRMAAGGKKGLETFKKKTKESVEEAMQHGDAKAAAHNFAKSHKNLAVTSVGNNHFVHHKAAKRGELEAAETFKFHHADGKIHVTHDSKDEHGGGFKGVRSRKAGSVNDAISHASKLFKMDEAYDEPQGQAKRIMSPLQKARMDKEKADRDRDGKLKSESKSFKDFREANTPVGQRDKMKIIDRKPHPDGGHIVTMQTKAGKTIKRHLKNGKVKDMKEAVSKLPGGNKHLATAGTKATIMHPVTRVSKKVDKKDLKKHVDAGWKHMGQKRNRVEDTDEGYASDAQRKAVWASKNEKGKKESVELDEVATPAMKKAGTELNAYAKKSGGIDKADFMKAADMLSTGKAGMEFIKFVNGQDTEVFEKIISVMSKHMGRQTVEKMFKVRVREATTVSEISKKTAQSYLDKTKGDDAWSGTRKANNRLKGAIHAVGKLRKKESVDEVLDTPKAMQSYKDKAKYSRDRASGSAAAKILSKGTLGSHKPELDTMRKRHKGMDMADRNAKKKTFDALRGKK